MSFGGGSFGMGDAERIAALDQRMANGVRKGVITAVDYARGVAKVRIGKIETDWLPWTTPGQNSRVATWSPVQEGQQVVVSSPSGDLRQGVIGGSLSSAAVPHAGDRGDLFRIQYSDGCREEYDMASKTYTLDVPSGGKIVLKVGPSSIEITDAGIKVVGPRIDLNP